jgi:hypothetical protein
VQSYIDLAESRSAKIDDVTSLREKELEPDKLLRTINQIALQKLDDRLVHYLKEKGRVTSSKVVNLSHEQIAQERAASRVYISR